MSVKTGLPRVSGGVSYYRVNAVLIEKSSPRKRGCFHTAGGGLFLLVVFPA